MKEHNIIEDPDDDDNDSLSTSSSTASNTSREHSPLSAVPSSPLAFLKRGAASTALMMEPLPPPPRIIVSSSLRRVRTRAVITRVPNHTPATPVKIAIDMRTRSSRLFFVLLHLVGISTNVPAGYSSSSNSQSSGRGSSSSDGSGSYSASDLLALLRQHRPSWLTWSVGIVGVHPTAILLERLHVETSRRGLKGILERVERVWGWDGDVDLLGEPYWFQDNVDGQCLGPGGGFSECGDATLWGVRRKPLTKRQLREKRYRTRHRKRLQEKKERNDKKSQQQIYQQGESTSSVCVWPFFCEEDSQFLQATENGYDEVYGFEYENFEEEEEGFALQLMDVDALTANSSFLSYRKKGLKDGGRRHERSLLWRLMDGEGDDAQDECLLSFPAAKNGGSTLQIGPCSSEAAWVWHVNRDGILVRGSTKAEKRRKKRLWKISPRKSAATGEVPSSQADFGCLHRTNSTSALLLPCDDGGNQHAEDNASLVGFSLVRYPSTLSKKLPRRQSEDENEWEPWTTLEADDVSVDGNDQSEATATENNQAVEQHLPTSRTSSQNHASAGASHHKVDLKSTASMLHTSLEQGGRAKIDAATSASHIRDAPAAMNGVAFHKQLTKDGDRSGLSKGPSATKLRVIKSKGRKGGQTPIHEESHKARGGEPGPDSNPHRPKKMPVHPYIQSSKDFVWVDPLTSLEYPTDLCRYLGHEKKEVGRHTLMGVGQYYRTAFNIKVYGAALYLAKRDVLADPKFGQYADLSSDDLRNRDDFYEHLMNMPAPGDDPATSLGGFFDRTLFIKINMQLSTDAMRKSLEADWSLLSDEMKKLIVDSSFEERMADERMQKKIQSKENSSNCSCGQSAPPELQADPTCCARGTELVFTWRKNGDFEVRLDGRLMDSFPRPDIAIGIFSEYLNNSPISLDAKAHFADGFPFLLAPLAQVKGMSSAVPQSHESTKEKKSHSGHNPMHRMMDAAVHSMGAMNNQAHTVTKWMHDSAAEMSSSAVGGAMGVARGLSEQLDRQRMDLLDNAVAFQREGMEMLTSLMKISAEENGMSLTLVDHAIPSLSPFSNGYDTYNEDVGPAAAPHEIIPDEIGIKIEPTMNFTHQLFFTTVHIYLLLMLVISIPGSNNTRLVVKRRILETKKFVESKSHGAFAAMSKLH